MSNLLSRISHTPCDTRDLPATTEQAPLARAKTPAAESPGVGFKKFAIAKNLDVTGAIPVISPAQHQAARRRLFDKLVRQVLGQKGHPFSGLDAQLKQDMINSITEELVQSHYKI
jgi:hypothetical protein